MNVQYRLCQTDEDFAQYTLFFIRHRTDFSLDFSLTDALMHTLETLHCSKIMLISDAANHVIGWGHYRYVTENGEPDPEGEIAFVDSVVVAHSYRSTRLFVEGFRQFVNLMASENKRIRQFQFYALADNAYLTRLYSKFASVIGQRDGYHGKENIFFADFSILKQQMIKW